MATNKKKKINAAPVINRKHLLILFAVPFLLYLQTYWFDFTYHDDNTIILYGSQVLKSFDLKKIFFTDAWLMDNRIELYRPFQSFTYAIDYFFAQGSPGFYHFHNLIIFCIGIQLLYFLLLNLGIPEKHSFWLSLLYSCHFLLAHVVCWIPARGDLYLAAFSIACIITWLKYFSSRKPLWLMAATALYFLALLSKENGMVLIPMVIIFAATYNRIDYKNLKTYVVFIPAIIVTAIYLYMRNLSVVHANNFFTFEGFIYNLPIIPEEIFKFFVPALFSVMPSFNTVATITGCAVIITLIGLIILLRKKIDKRLIILGICIFMIPSIPVVLYKPVFVGFAYDYLDHRMLFPGIGLLLIVYALITSLPEKNIPTYILPALAGVMSVITFFNARNYTNYETYFENAIHYSPGSGLAWIDYGACLALNNKYDEALKKFREAVRLYPKNMDFRMKIADSYLTLKDYPKMIKECNDALAVDSNCTHAYHCIAMYYNEFNKTDSALHVIATAIRKDSLNAETYFYRGAIHKKAGMIADALDDFTRSIRVNPQYARPYFERGNIYGNNNKFEDALNDYNKYVELNPNDGAGYFYRGQSYCLLGNKTQGCEDLHTALKMGVKDAEGKISQFCQ